MSEYDSWAPVYDAWAADMTEDVAHYVSLAREADGPIVELMVGSGRVAIEVVRETGKPVLGIDSSPAMLEIARERSAGLPLELRFGDVRELELDEPAALIYVPFRSLLHLHGWQEKRRVFERVAASLRPGGRFAFNAFVFSHTIAARLDGTTQDQSGVVHTLRYVPADNRIEIERDDAATIRIWWATKSEWDGLLDVAGLEVEALYGGFDRRAVRRRVARVRLRRAEALSVYDPIAWLYDPWSASVIEDVSFYVDEALAAGGEVVELGVGTGRIAIPTALAGAHVIGVDSSAGMLAVCAERAREAGVAERLDLRLGDLRRPPVDERVPLVTCPFRSYLHLRDDDERLEALRAARELLRPGGRLVFDVFTPSREDIEETHGRWIEREPGIDERADWDLAAQTLTLSVRGTQGSSTMTLWWVEPERWHSLLAEAGFEVLECYGWFDRRPFAGGEDSVWIALRK